MATIEDLLAWIAADFARFAPVQHHVQVVSDTTGAPERRLVLALFTTQSRYQIVAVEGRGPYGQAAGIYLGAQVSARAPRPGETHTRGRDLTDGPLARATWDRILADIVACELVRVHAERTLCSAPLPATPLRVAPPPFPVASPGGI